MAFDYNNLILASVAPSVGGKETIFYYETEDDLSTVEGDNYFGRLNRIFKRGDILCVSADDGKRLYNVHDMNDIFSGAVYLQSLANVSTFPFV